MKSGKLEAEDLKKSFISLMDETHKEQVYQEYLESNTALIPREFVQNHGVHFGLVLRKPSLAKDYTPDFVYLSKSSTDWNCVLVEIEKPQSKYFKEGTNDFHPDFLTGLDQINRWRAWFENRANFYGFFGGTIAPIMVPESMRRNPCYLKYVLVHGRRSEFEGNDTRRGLIRSQEREDFHVLSYDSLLEALYSKGQLYVGTRKNEHIEIISENFVDEDLFSWVDSSYLKITDKLRANILANKSTWYHQRVDGGLVLDHVLPIIGTCSV